MAAIDSFSTQKNENGRAVAYRLRTDEDIRRITYYVMNGNAEGRPVFSSSRGFTSSVDDPDMISKEILLIQNLYKKTSGIRIREETVSLDKEELGKEKMREAKAVADVFGSYYLGLGHQVAYGIYDHGTRYEIRYAINTVNFADGGKYKYNKHTIRDQEENCLETVIADVTGRGISESHRFDFENLEYYYC